jgi:hypothetical protein
VNRRMIAAGLTRQLLLLSAIGVVSAWYQPVVADTSKAKYVFVPDTNRWVGVIRDKKVLVGKLDAKGNFAHVLELDLGAGFSAGVPNFEFVNDVGLPEKKKAYEYRSGVLVPGELQRDGSFVPEIGGKIIHFKDYTYTPDGPKIWNLPGWFSQVRGDKPAR